ncbi:MerR family transcriptional regulator [Saccharopolyspora sp. 5N708]|uniref:MerR family transcriptional regulator n=1 Tax=Saccharopolyspora sp. 5N708 TaxID=3457424 RepID=UPI003FD50AAE
MQPIMRLHVDMRSSDGSLSIGEVAARFGIGTHVLRHWEDIGLLEPRRDSAGRRQFDDADVIRVAVIVRSKNAGMSLPQVRALVDGEVADRREVLVAHLQQLDMRMAEMARHREMTVHALECRAHDIMACPRFAASVSDLLTY